MGTEVVARPVNRSGWKLWTVEAAGGGALPAETIEAPRWDASARGGRVICAPTTMTAVTPAVNREVSVGEAPRLRRGDRAPLVVEGRITPPMSELAV